MTNDMVYTVSARGKKAKQPIDEFLKTFFSSLPIENIDSVFGFVEPTTLYSGRIYLHRQITDSDYAIMKQMNIGMRLPFTNHYCTKAEYEENKPLFEKYHEKGNSVITANEDLAKWVRADFPLYSLEASILKEIKTNEDVEKALDIYDTVVLPMNLNYNKDLLNSIIQKDRITLFGNGGCALSCPDRICYEYVSKQNKEIVKKSLLSRYMHFTRHMVLKRDWCSQMISPRKLHGLKDFDLGELRSMGYKRFKMLREYKERNSGY